MAFPGPRAALISSRSRFTCLVALIVSLGQTNLVWAADGAPPKLELRQGDHVSLIGNTLADRMQHDGWLETYIQSRFPDRNSSFATCFARADD